SRSRAGSTHGRSSSTRPFLDTEWTTPNLVQPHYTNEARGGPAQNARLVGRWKAQRADHLQLARPLVRKVGKVRSVEDPVRAPAQDSGIGPAGEVPGDRHGGVEIQMLELVEHGFEFGRLVPAEMGHDADGVGMARERAPQTSRAGDCAHVD